MMKGSHSAVVTSRRKRWSSGAAGLLCPLLGACLWAAVAGYKPVIIVHGLFDSSGDFKNLQRFINEVSGREKKRGAASVWLCRCILVGERCIQFILQGLKCAVYILQALQLISPHVIKQTWTCTMQDVLCHVSQLLS